MAAAAVAWAPPRSSATAFVDFAAASGSGASALPRTSQLSYGLNIYSGFSEGTATSAAYQSCVQDTLGAPGVGLLRYHREQQMEDSSQSSVGWIVNASTPGACAWNTSRISAVLTAAPWLKTAPSARRVMMGITGWPACMANASGNGALLPGMQDAFASLCADLVTLVNGRLGLGIGMFEVTNELDSKSEYMNNMSVVGTIVATAARAMRAAQDRLAREGLSALGGDDLSIGGPAFARPDLTHAVQAFVSTAGADVDFLSYHSYSTGDSTKANSSIWDSAQSAGSLTDGVRGAAVKACLAGGLSARLCASATSTPAGKAMSLLHDEINISWDPPDVRMTNAVGAVYDALAHRSVQAHGGAAARWNEADGWYGACNGGAGFERRPPSFAHEVMARYARGVLVPSASAPSDGTVVAAKGTTTTGWTPAEGEAAPSTHAVTLINRSGGPATVTVRAFFDGAAPGASTPVGLHTVTADGRSDKATTWGALAPGGSPVLDMDINAITVIEWNATSA